MNIVEELDAGSVDFGRLVEVWESVSVAGSDDPGVFVQLGKRFSERGEHLLAYDVLEAGRRRFPRHNALLHRLGVVLADLQRVEEARDVARELVHRDPSPDSLSLLGRAHKDLALRQPAAREREALLRESHGDYLDAARLAEERGSPHAYYYSAINAATTIALAGDIDGARRLAEDVRRTCEELLPETSDLEPRRWVLSTLGEAAMLLGNFPRARAWWCQAVELDPASFRDLARTRRQAERIAAMLGEDADELDSCFPKPCVVVFAGHMVDRPGRAPPRFPSAIEDAVAARIDEWLSENDAVISYSSAACGSDIIFLERMLERGKERPGVEAHVVLPTEPKEFVTRSVAGVSPHGDWRRRYEAVMEKVTTTRVANRESTLGDPVGYEHCNRIIAGMAVLKREALLGVLKPLVVWNRELGDGPGGTAWVHAMLEASGHAPCVIDPTPLAADLDVGPEPDHDGWDGSDGVEETRLPPGFRQRIATMLFADVQRYSDIPNHCVPAFVERVMGLVRDELSDWGVRILQRGTWGDALYLVFASAVDAGCAALLLQDRLRQESWSDHELPEDLALRIALHTGPVHHCVDPVTGAQSYTGASVSLAARIEPVVRAGEVYASESFATHAASEGTCAFDCRYLGVRALPKGYGTFPVYAVTCRAREEVDRRRRREGRFT